MATTRMIPASLYALQARKRAEAKRLQAEKPVEVVEQTVSTEPPKPQKQKR